MSAPPSAAMRLADLAAAVGASVAGDCEIRIHDVGTLESAGAGCIAFLANPAYRPQLATTRASAVILAPRDAEATTLPRLIAGNPYAAYAKIAALLHPSPPRLAGRHPSAVIDPAAIVAADASIGAKAIIGRGARIGARAEVGPGCIVGEDVELGDDARLVAAVTIYRGCRIGPRTLVHAGAVIGADGFGMAEEEGRWIRVPQLGRVVIGADCEVGANTTIDRGAIDDTVIEDDVKLDNQIQIGHNCHIGRHTAIAGCAGVAGSVRIGRNCKIGGGVGISGHLEICDDVVVSGGAVVSASIREPGRYTGVFPILSHREWMHCASQVRRLRDLAERVRALERVVQAKSSSERKPE